MLDFYERRIRRIFPVLIVVLLTTLAAGFCLLTPEELKMLGKHVVGGAAYVSNIVLWKEAGYFDQSAVFKPLLHLWSLGVEEQFYIVWPLLLWLLYKSRLNFLTATLVFTAVSFVLCMWGISRHATATFFAPWTRVWELSFGGVLAWLTMNGQPSWPGFMRFNAVLSRVVYRGDTVKPDAWRNVLSFFGLVLIVVGLCTIKHSSTFPSFNALLPVLGAVFIIAAGSESWFNRCILSHRIAVFIGLISYPLYLWHWPLLSFEHIVWGGNPPALWRAVAVVTAFVLAWITYRFVEPPLRYGKYPTIKAAALFLVLVGIGVSGYVIFKGDGVPSRVGRTAEYVASQVEAEVVLDDSRKRCETKFPAWMKEDNKCRMQRPMGENTVAVIGDSHAGHLFAGLATSRSKYSFEVFPGSGGVPFVDVASMTQGAEWRKTVYLRHREAYQHIVADPAIRVVLLAHNPACSWQDAIDMRNPDDKDVGRVLRTGLKRTLDMLQQSGKKVIFVLDNPSLPFEPSRCGKRPIAVEHKCKISRKLWSDNKARQAYEKLVTEAAEKYSNVSVVDLADRMCDRDNCYVVRNNLVLYRDSNHLNIDGSKWVAPVLLQAINKALSER